MVALLSVIFTLQNRAQYHANLYPIICWSLEVLSPTALIMWCVQIKIIIKKEKWNTKIKRSMAYFFQCVFKWTKLHCSPNWSVLSPLCSGLWTTFFTLPAHLRKGQKGKKSLQLPVNTYSESSTWEVCSSAMDFWSLGIWGLQGWLDSGYNIL